MKNKNLICLFMAALIFAMSMPAFAAEGGELEVEQSAQADTNMSIMGLQDPIVDVAVPATGTLYINPLGFPVHYEYDYEEVTDNSQILTEPAYIENRGDDPVRVSVSVTGAAEGGMGLTSLPTKAQSTTSKKAFIYFEIQSVSDYDRVTWDKEYDATKHVPVRNGTKSKKNIVELDDASGRNCYGAFRLTGDCVAKPKIPWSAADKLTVTIAFTFKPIITIE